ncbi:MAG TPA: tRNA pseudouridine(13) synthase TruD [Trueperaceae bacterium]
MAVTPNDLDLFRFRWSDLPPVTADLPGTGGIIRATPEDFQVHELPLYLPEGAGSHAYARVRKRNLTTRDLVRALMRAGVPERDIGVAGLKDKHAVTEQWLSVPNRHAAALEALGELEGVTVLEASRHRNKLGIGHLRGNRFTVRVRQAQGDAPALARAILDELAGRGVPNYFGPQRFGRHGGNAIDGLKLVRGQSVPGGHMLKRFFVSALQSQLFNHTLTLRLERGLFARVVTGDWAKKHDTGGVFEVADSAAESPRAEHLEISATLPLYGKKVRISSGEAGELEGEALEHFGLRWTDFTSRKGARRISRILPEDVSLEPADDGYLLGFTLPKGAFATNVLREVMKVDVDVAGSQEEGEDSDG